MMNRLQRPGAHRLLRRGGALALVCAIAACAAPEGEGTVELDALASAGPSALCQEARRLEAVARQENFTLDFAQAEQHLRTVAQIRGMEGVQPVCGGPVATADAWSELALSLSSQGKFRLADGAFSEARGALGEAPAPVTEAEVGAIQLAGARIYAYEAMHEVNRRDYAVTPELSADALALLTGGGGLAVDLGDDQLFRADRAEQDRVLLEVVSLHASAAANARQGDFSLALAEIDRASQSAAALKGGSDAVRSRIQVEQAALQVAAGQPEAGLLTATTASEVFARELADTPLLARALLTQGIAQQELGRRTAAYDLFQQAIDVYTENPAELGYERLWPFIRVVLDLRRQGALSDDQAARDVFRAAQVMRSATAASDIAASAAQFEAGSGSAAAAVREWRRAQEDVQLLTAALSRRDLEAFERESLETQLASAQRDETRLRARRDDVAPEYRAAIETPVTLDRLQAALAPGEAVLLPLIGEPRSVVLLITSDDIVLESLIVGGDAVGQITRLVRDSVSYRPDGRIGGFAVDTSWLLYNMLLTPIEAELASVSRLYVSPTGALQGLPFEVLVTEDPTPLAAATAAGDYSGLAWLGAKTPISYLPSPRSLVDLRDAAGASAAGRPFIGFGDFRPGADPAAGIDGVRRRACGPEVDAIRSMPPLPGTELELRRISEIIGPRAEIVEGEAFTEARVKSMSADGSLADYRMLLFATHGLLWPNADCFQPALAASSLELGPDQDGLLESSEIRNLRLDAELVVLSACQSTDPLSETAAGEVLSGLTRAFLAAGSRSVLASHWEVDDAAAAEMLPAFFEAVEAGQPIDAALRAAQAQLRARPEMSHPILWAPFVLFGDGARAPGGA